MFIHLYVYSVCQPDEGFFLYCLIRFYFRFYSVVFKADEVAIQVQCLPQCAFIPEEKDCVF